MIAEITLLLGAKAPEYNNNEFIRLKNFANQKELDTAFDNLMNKAEHFIDSTSKLPKAAPIDFNVKTQLCI